MLLPTQTILVSVKDNEHCKRLSDPVSAATFHMETLLPFTEAAKLPLGTANVRGYNESKKPFQDMLETVEAAPETFHIKNRGITYLCEKFEFDNSKRQLRIQLPQEGTRRGGEYPIYGIADGGHTFEVIRRTLDRLEELRSRDGWMEPFVRVHFLSGEATAPAIVEEVVEALNTSSQVQQYSLDDYQGKFGELKEALTRAGFDVGQVAFRENDEKPWNVVEIIQRIAYFLKERWQHTHPASMYRSKGKALDLYISDATREEFRRLYDVIKDIVTLPEYIQSRLSSGEHVELRSFGRLNAVSRFKLPYTRECTTYPTRHKLHAAALVPMAAAFRELLTLKGDRYQWRARPDEVFPLCVEQLYRALTTRMTKVRQVSHLASDMEYWGACSTIVMRALVDMSTR